MPQHDDWDDIDQSQQTSIKDLFDTGGSPIFPGKNSLMYQLWVILTLCFFVSAFWPQVINEFGLKPIDIVQDFSHYALTSITSLFLHATFWHLFSNLISLAVAEYILMYVMPLKERWLLFLLSGVTGCFIYTITTNEPMIPLIGASSGVFGLIGATLAFWPRIHLLKLPDHIYYAKNWILALLAIMSVQQVYFSLTEQDSIVAYYGHVGGLIAGLLYVALRSTWRGSV